MKTIGKIFKESRARKRISLLKLEEKTKIKKEFIQAIEKENWEQLPEYPIVLGFVKSIAERLEIDPNKATALLRRDYPPKVLRINPKPDVFKKFVWSPKLTFLIGISMVLVVIATYLGIEYRRFVSPPRLNLELPVENQVVEGNKLLVKGSTDIDSTVEVNNQPVIIDNDGNFSLELAVSGKTKQIVVVAKSRSGKKTTIERNIVSNFDN